MVTAVTIYDSNSSVTIDTADVEITLPTIVGGGPSISVIGDYIGNALPGGSHFRWVPSSPSATWLVTHNLGYYPNIVILDSNKEVIYGRIEHLDASVFIVEFNVLMMGSVEYI